MHGVGWLVALLPVLLAQRANRFLAVLAAFLAATHRPLQPLELLQATLQMPVVGNDGPIRQRGEGLHAQVYANGGAIVDWHRLFLFHLDTHIPMPRLLCDG